MAVNKHIDLPFTVTGGLSTGDNGGTNTLSGYTNALTEFKFKIADSSYFFSPPWISNDKFVWDLGDGTVTKGVSAKHIYKYPGIYNVSLIGYTSGGQEYLSTYTKELSVGNFLIDSLTLDTTDDINVISIPAGTTTGRIKVNRTTSWQPHFSLSGEGYTISFYASGSLSNQLDVERYEKYKWSHLDQTWSFFEPATANDNTITYTPIESIKTSEDESIYYISGEANEAQVFTRVLSSYLDTASGSSAVFVGTSGTAEVVYVDDTPKIYDDPVFLYGFLDTSKFPHYDNILKGEYSSSNSSLKYSEHYGITIPVRIKFAPGQSIKFTSSGIRSMDISKIKYQLTEIPFFVGLDTEYETLIQAGSAIKVLPASDGSLETDSTFVVNLSTLSGSDSDFTNTVLLSTHYFKEDDVQLPSSLEATFRGFFIPIETADNAKLLGKVTVLDEPNFVKDLFFGYITHNDHGEEMRLFFKTKYHIDSVTGEQVKTKDITTHKYTYLPAGKTAGDMHYIQVPIAVVHDSNNVNDNSITSYIANHTVGDIQSFNTFNHTVTTFNYTNPYIQDVGNIENIESVYSSTNTSAAASATSLAVAEDRSVYITQPHFATVLQLSAVNNRVINVYTHSDENATYNVPATGDNRLSVPYGITITRDNAGLTSLLQPSIVETGKDANIWLAYTNPVSSTLRKYNTSRELVAEYEFDQAKAITDMKCDNRGNLWAAVENKFRFWNGFKNEGTVNDYNRSLSALAITGAASKSNEQFNYIFTTTGFTISADEILEVTGLEAGTADSKWYNGFFLVESVSSNPTKTSVDVNPYIGVYNQASTSTGSVTLTAIKRPSDRLYKFDSNGSLLFTVSGLLSPEYVAVDRQQQVWVSHNTDTISQFNSSGEKLQDVLVRSSSYAPVFVSAGADLIKAVDVDGSVHSPLSANEHHIGGISFDTYDNVFVINGFENRLFTIPSATPTLSSEFVFNSDTSPASAKHGFIYGKVEAKGDWTGFNWLNKFNNTYGLRTLTGETTFGIYSSGGRYSVSKVNEDFDPAATIKTYRFAPNMIQNNKLFDEFLGTIVGTVSSDVNSLGRVIYEKISNFVDNHSDPDTCNIDSLYSLLEMYGVDVNQYNYTYPGRLQRIMNIVSISHSGLWGGREKYDRDIDIRRPGASLEPDNLGEELDITTYMVSADMPIVSKHLYNSDYRKVVTGYIEPYEATGHGSVNSSFYESKYNTLSSYPLSGYTPYWGWGLTTGVSGTDIEKTVKFYEYKEGFTNIQVEGTIDWNNPHTTLNESLSDINSWTEDNGIVEQLIDIELRKGLQLFTPVLSSYTTGEL